MGFNTTIVIRNDALHQIENDPEFGRKLVEAIMNLNDPRYKGRRLEVAAGNHANVAQVVETHHADLTSIVTVGGNLGVHHGTFGGWRHTEEKAQRDLVRMWGEKLGMKVTYKEPEAKAGSAGPKI